MLHASENERPAVVTDWAFARDHLARPQGKAGYLTVGDGTRADHWLVIDLPIYGMPLQVSYPVDLAFITAWPLPVYLGGRVAAPDNTTALRLYGSYIANERAVTGLLPTATADLFESDDERRMVAGRRAASLPRPRRASSRKIGVVKSGEPDRAVPPPALPRLGDPPARASDGTFSASSLPDH